MGNDPSTLSFLLNLVFRKLVFHNFRNLFRSFRNRKFALPRFVAQGNLDNTALAGFRRHDGAHRNAEQIRIREHRAGTDIAVVVKHLDSRRLQGFIQTVRRRAHDCVVTAEIADLHLPRGDGHRPNGAVIVVAFLADRSAKPSDADAVAAHNRIFRLSVRIKIGHAHRFRIFGSELEDVPDLDSLLNGNHRFSAGRAYRARVNLRNIDIVDVPDIARDVEARIVIIRLVRAADEIAGSGKRTVPNDRNPVGKSERTDKARDDAAFLRDDRRMEFTPEEIAQLGLIDVEIAADKDDDVGIVRIFSDKRPPCKGVFRPHRGILPNHRWFLHRAYGFW